MTPCDEPIMTKHYDVAIIGLGTMGSFAAVELAQARLFRGGLRSVHSASWPRQPFRWHPHLSPRLSRRHRLRAAGAARGRVVGPGRLSNWARNCCTAPACSIWGFQASPSSTKCGRAHPPIGCKWRRSRPAEVFRRYPAFEIPEDYVGLFDVQAGWIDVDASIASSLAYAQSLGCRNAFSISR